MSHLFRQSLKDNPPRPRPAPIPVPPTPETLPPDDHPPSDSSSSSASSAASAQTLRPNSRDQPPSSNHWTNYFAQSLSLPHQTATSTATYHAYLTPPSNPIKDPLILTHHGAGSSALSFALFSSELRSHLPTAGVLSLDARGHGDTTVLDSSSNLPVEDYSLETLTTDALTVLQLTQSHLQWPKLPPLVLLGHSLGGAVLTNLALNPAVAPHLVGTIVIDVVEGSALSALHHMTTYLATRPSTFASEQQAITWHLRSRTLHNPTSASISVPPLLKPTARNTAGDISEEQLTWKTDLSLTSPFWPGWFTGMSSRFLRTRGAKMLILAGTDRLDKELMVGQMQGKFQLEVVAGTGHFVHEDAAGKVAECVAGFWRRNGGVGIVLPPKVSELLAQGKKV